MPALLPIVLTGSYLVLAAEQIPRLDTDRACHAAASASAANNRNEDSCKRDESKARAKLEQEWGQFTRAQQEHCVALSKLGGFPSYVELLTCLEMETATTKLPATDKMNGGAPK